MRTPPNERLSPDIAGSPSRLREGLGVGKSTSRRNSPTPDPSRKREGSERRCILTGASETRDALVRLAASPSGLVLPDAQEKAPGRGAWVCSSRSAIEEAQADGKLKAGLSRAFKTGDLEIPGDLPQKIEDALTRVLLDRLGLEMRVGALILGTQRIAETARGGGVALLLHAEDASEDGRKKLDQAWRVGRDAEGSGERGWTLPLDRDALSVALGRDNVVHLGLANDAAAARVLKPLKRLMHYQGRAIPEEFGRADARHNDDTID